MIRLKNDIINRLSKKAMTTNELTQSLKLFSRTEKRQLANALMELKEDGRIINKGRGRIAATPQDHFIKGELRGNRRGFAFLVREDGKGEDIFIPNRALSGAMHGDTVLARLTGDSEGAVVSVVEQGIKRLVGTYIISGGYGFVVPDDDSYFKDILIRQTDTNGATPMSKVVVSIKIDENSQKPYGKVEKVLGRAGERNAEVLSILNEYGFNEEFPKSVISAAEKLSYSHSQNRKDFRELLTITIDGESAKDFDDAISVEKHPFGYRLYVHIADVAHYVRAGGVIDREAMARGTSVYFPSSVFPMLPISISNDICSLLPEQDRFCLSVVMDINEKGAVIKSEFFESIINSDYRMTYTNVTKILDGDKTLEAEYAGVVEMLQHADKLAEVISQNRKKHGSIDFVTRETMVELDENGDVVNISAYPDEISNNIIEQFMITTNITVATYLTQKALPCIYRVHQPPSPEKVESFINFVNSMGYNVNIKDGISPQIYSDILAEIKGNDGESVINKIMLKTMQKAKYSVHNVGHFGLILDCYCHFTSPIRRYPDLMVHRVLKAVINKKTDAKFITTYKNLCELSAATSSERELAADRAERDIDDYYKALYMADKVGEKYTGIVSGILNSGIFVALDNTVEGMIAVADLPQDSYQVDDKNYRLLGKKHMFTISDKVEVEIKSVNVNNRKIDMLIISPPEQHFIKKQLEKPSNKTRNRSKR